MSLVPMDKVVRDACRAMGDPSSSKYMTVVQHANAAYRDLTLYVIPYLDSLSIMTSTLSPGPTKAILLPEDFVYETKIGICRGNHIAVLGVNENMCVDGISYFDHCDCPSEADAAAVESVLCGCAITNSPGFAFYNYTGAGGAIGELYGMGLGGNVNGYYRIDKKKNVLYVNGLRDDEKIVIEYKSNGVGAGAELIPTEAENCIQEYIFWKMYRFTDKAASQIARQQYEIEYNKLKKMYLSYTMEELHDVILRNVKPTVKN